MAKSLPFRLTITPAMPKSIKECLEGSVKKLREEYGNEYAKKLEEYKKSLGNNIIPDEGDIYPLLGKISAYEKIHYLEAHIIYLALATYWHREGKIEASWSYYSIAQYYLGCFDSWGKLEDSLVNGEAKQQNQAKGGELKNIDGRKPFMDALKRTIVDKRPVGGWKSKKDLFKAAEIEFNAIYKDPKYKDKDKNKKLLSYDNLENQVMDWLRRRYDIASLYSAHASPQSSDQED